MTARNPSKPVSNQQLGLIIGLAALLMFSLALVSRRLLFHIVFQ